VNWNFQEILTKDLVSASGCDTSGNVPPCGVVLRRTCRCTEFHRVKNANLRHPSAVMCWIDSTSRMLLRSKSPELYELTAVCGCCWDPKVRNFMNWLQFADVAEIQESGTLWIDCSLRMLLRSKSPELYELNAVCGCCWDPKVRNFMNWLQFANVAEIQESGTLWIKRRSKKEE